VPLETEFLQTARANGLIGVDGLGMLLHQAVPGFEKWFGVRPVVTSELYQIIARDIGGAKC
jgi:shikimate dehydrogenase